MKPISSNRLRTILYLYIALALGFTVFILFKQELELREDRKIELLPCNCEEMLHSKSIN